MLYISKVLNSKQPALVKLTRLSSKKIANVIYTPNVDIKCGWQKIASYLSDTSEEEKAYFESRLKFLIKSLRNVNPQMRIHFLTIPHRDHILNNYKLSVGNIIRNFLRKNSFINVYQIDFENHINRSLSKGLSVNDIYIKDDKASHLTDFAHNEILLPKLMEEINKNF